MILAYISIIVTIAAIVIVALKLASTRLYPVIIYVIGLLMLWTTTMQGLSVIGSDISSELLMTNLAIKNGWDISIIESNNTSLVVAWLLPAISKLTTIDPTWLYKILLPMIFACTPLTLFVIFRKQIGDIKAFYAAVFFIAMPVFNLEMATIGKTMVSETLMVLVFWVMFTEWRVWLKAMLILVLTVLTILTHYTIGILLVAYLVAIFGIMLITKFIPRWKLWKDRTIPLWVFVIVIVISMASFLGYYAYVAKGLVAANVSMIINSPSFKLLPPEQMAEMEKTYTIRTMNNDSLLRLGVGKDFLEASAVGKVFRLVQYLTQALIIAGCAWLLVRYKRYKFRAEFVAGVGASLVLLVMCIFVPNFSNLINMTRFYHISLVFLAPMLVVGCDALTEIKCSKR